MFVQSPDVKFITDHDELNLGVLWSDSISINSCKIENVDVYNRWYMFRHDYVYDSPNY